MPLTGQDLANSDFCSYQLINQMKNNWYGATAPTDPQTGMIWIDSSSGVAYVYDGSAWIPVADKGGAPIGSIVAWCPGYFGDGSNGSYTNALGSGNTVAYQNAYLNGNGWYVCNGAALASYTSPIFGGTGRYLPNLTDDRFIMGDTAAGGSGGGNVNDHLHACNPPSFDVPASANVTKAVHVVCSALTANAAHTHTVDIAEFDSGVPSDTENRPAFLALYYIMRVW